MNKILEGVVGSKCYGLDTIHSDTDMFGVFVSPTRDILSLSKPKDCYDGKNDIGDYKFYEVEKFIKLALQCNPTVLEFLYLNDYTIKDSVGQTLIDNKSAFLSHRLVRSAYLGYATGQLTRLLKRGDTFSSSTKNRVSKHARHIVRLMFQGQELMETGKLTVKLDANKAIICHAYGELAEKDPLAFKNEFELLQDEFLATAEESVLPEKPDYTIANEILLRIRQANW